jgi:indole-3-glycerol phosphate synthase
MDILDKIVAHKKTEVAQRQELYPIKLLEQSIFFETDTVSMVQYLRREDKVGIIAEFKRKSPSKGVINAHASVEKVSIGYMQAGASGLSVLTDTEFFGGSSKDLEEARKFNFCPILRKDFIIDDYQVIEAKSIGADTILLIARILTEMDIKRMSSLARRLGMEVLLEVHDETDIEKASYDVDIMGVNNRNLSTFETSIETSKTLAPLIPDTFMKISESGIRDADTVIDLMAHGFEGFLVGEQFMKSSRPEVACKEFIQSIRQKQGK